MWRIQQTVDIRIERSSCRKDKGRELERAGGRLKVTGGVWKTTGNSVEPGAGGRGKSRRSNKEGENAGGVETGRLSIKAEGCKRGLVIKKLMGTRRKKTVAKKNNYSRAGIGET